MHKKACVTYVKAIKSC